MKKRILINKDGTKYRVFQLIETSDKSILLKTYKANKSLQGSRLGKYMLKGFTARIFYNSNTATVKEIDHSTVHPSGQSHVKLIDGFHKNIQQGVPLERLNKARHLWTIVSGNFTKSNIVTVPRKTDFIINEPQEMSVRAIVIMAVPKGNINFEVSFDITKLTKIPPDLGFFLLEFSQFNIAILIYSTNLFEKSPPYTYKFPSMGQLCPFIIAVTDEYIDLELRPVLNSEKFISKILNSFDKPSRDK